MTTIGLAPMDGVTNQPFRQTQVELCRPDIVFTEFVSAEGITRGGIKLFDELLYAPVERPIVGQIFGKDPEAFYKATLILCYLGFDRIDINMGCPAKTVIQHGSGAALIEKPQLASEIINAAKQGIADYLNNKKNISKAIFNQATEKVIARNLEFSGFNPTSDSRINISISVKTRVGIVNPTLEIWINHLLKHNLDFITIHGRTLKQGYGGRADWELIKKAVKLAQGTKTKIWGSGDVKNRAQAEEYSKLYNVNGVLIGRSAMDNPYCFQNLIPSSEMRFAAMVKLTKNTIKTFPDRKIDYLRKVYLSYTLGLPNAKELRSHLIYVKSLSDLLILKPLFHSL